MTDNTLIAATKARKEYLGDISDMTLYRWLNDPDMGFPRPIVINRRRYWHESDIAAWLESRSQEAA